MSVSKTLEALHADSQRGRKARPSRSCTDDGPDLIDVLQNVREERHGQWTATCPVPTHGDANPSFSVGFGDHQRYTVTCHGGCESEEVLQAIGELGVDMDRPPVPVDERGAAASRQQQELPTPAASPEQIAGWQEALAMDGEENGLFTIEGVARAAG